MEKLTPKEHKVLDNLEKKLDIKKRKTKKPVVVGMIGLVGVGKHEVAEELASHIGGTVVSGDEIRVALRKAKASFDNTRSIAEGLGLKIIEKGGNVLVASDFVDMGKRNHIKETIKGRDISKFFVRVICDRDVLIGRIISQKYGSKLVDLFTGSETTWGKSNPGAVVKLREMWRRTPHHYSWSMDDGGQWIQKTLNGIFAEIDTTDPRKWKEKAKQVAKRMHG